MWCWLSSAFIFIQSDTKSTSWRYVWAPGAPWVKPVLRVAPEELFSMVDKHHANARNLKQIHICFLVASTRFAVLLVTGFPVERYLEELFLVLFSCVNTKENENQSKHWWCHFYTCTHRLSLDWYPHTEKRRKTPLQNWRLNKSKVKNEKAKCGSKSSIMPSWISLFTAENACSHVAAQKPLQDGEERIISKENFDALRWRCINKPVVSTSKRL